MTEQPANFRSERARRLHLQSFTPSGTLVSGANATSPACRVFLWVEASAPYPGP